MKKYKKYFIFVIIIFILTLLTFLFFINKKPSKIFVEAPVVEQKGFLVKEVYIAPNTKEILKNDSKLLASSSINTLFVPKNDNEKIIIPFAVLTLKEAYNLAVLDALKWDNGAKLFFVKSLGAVTLDGRSSQWQIVFSAKEKNKKAYEIIIQKNKIVSQKEIISEIGISGVDLPEKWPDSGDFIKTLQGNKNFSQATFNSLLLGSTPESTDAKWWFSLGTSKGVVTFEIK